MTIIDDSDAIKSHGHQEASEAQFSFRLSCVFSESRGASGMPARISSYKGSISFYYTMSQAAMVSAPFVHRALAEVDHE